MQYARVRLVFLIGLFTVNLYSTSALSFWKRGLKHAIRSCDAAKVERLLLQSKYQKKTSEERQVYKKLIDNLTCGREQNAKKIRDAWDLYNPRLISVTTASFNEFNELLYKSGLNRIRNIVLPVKDELEINFDHLLRRLKQKSTVALLKEKNELVNAPLPELKALLKTVEFVDKDAPGYIPKEEYFEDGKQKKSMELESLLASFAMTGFSSDYSIKFKHIVYALKHMSTTDEQVLKKRNLLLVEMAMAATHCSTRREEYVDKACSELEIPPDTFEDELDNLLARWRRQLLAAVFVIPYINRLSSNEYGTSLHYWHNRLGYYIGDRNVDPNFYNHSAYVMGSEKHNSIEKNVEKFFAVYHPTALIDYVLDHLENPQNYPHEDHFKRFHEFLEKQNQTAADYMDEDLIQFDREKITNLLIKLGYVRRIG